MRTNIYNATNADRTLREAKDSDKAIKDTNFGVLGS